jgi:hypothetical protein
MTLMSVNNPEQGKDRDYRSLPRWSAGKKTDAVLRLRVANRLSRSPVSSRSRRTSWPPSAWREDFLAAGKHGLKGQPPDQAPDHRALSRPNARSACSRWRRGTKSGGCRWSLPTTKVDEVTAWLGLQGMA